MKRLQEEIPIREPGNILAMLFRQIIHDRGLVSVMDSLIELRLSELNEFRPSSKKLSKGPLTAEVLSESMTFNSFNNLIFNVCKLEDVCFNVSIGDNHDRYSVKPEILLSGHQRLEADKIKRKSKSVNKNTEANLMDKNTKDKK